VPSSAPPTVSVPTTAGELVDMAVSSLGMTKAQVIAKATEVLGPKVGGGQRSPADIARLWQILAQESTAPPPPAAAHPVASPAEPDPIDEVDLTDLVDAPDHEEQLLEQLSQAFPGAELLPNDQDDQHD